MKHYHQRSNAESTFSMIKAKFRDHVRSRTEHSMKNEVLCKFICHNICCVIQSQCELGIDATFWDCEETRTESQEPPVTSEPEPVTLPMAQPALDFVDAFMWM